MFWSEACVTCHKFIAGRSLKAAEQMPGLGPAEPSDGAGICEFVRLPTAEELDTRGCTRTPGGQPWHAGCGCLAGAGAAQSQIRKGTHVPARLIAAIQPGQNIP